MAKRQAHFFPDENGGGNLISVETILTVHHPGGLHLRPAAHFVRTAGQFNSAVRLTNLSRPGSPEVDGKSMFAVMQSGVSVGHTIRVRAEGPDAQAAITALRALVEQNFPNA
jgi:phosphotransferase system HPr (HPr) family protein